MLYSFFYLYYFMLGFDRKNLFRPSHFLLILFRLIVQVAVTYLNILKNYQEKNEKFSLRV